MHGIIDWKFDIWILKIENKAEQYEYYLYKLLSRYFAIRNSINQSSTLVILNFHNWIKNKK